MFESLFGSGSGGSKPAATTGGTSPHLQVTRASGVATDVTLDSQGDLVTAIAWLANGQVIVTGTRGGDVRFWEAKPSPSRSQSAPLLELAPVKARIEALCAPPTGPSLSLLAVSDTAPAEIATLTVSRILDNLDPVTALAADPVSGSKRVAVGTGAAVRVWQPATPQIVSETVAPLPLAGNVRALAWSTDGQSIAAAIGDKGILVWSAPNVSQSPVVVETPGAIADLALRTISGKSILVTTDASSGTVRAWSLPFPAPITRSAPAGGFLLFAASADGSTVAVASNGQIRVWSSDDLAHGNPGQTITLGSGETLNALALTQDGSHLACAVTGADKLRYYNMSNSAMTEITGSPTNVTALACWHDGAGPPVTLSLAAAGKFQSDEPSVTILSLKDVTGTAPPTKVVKADLTSIPGPFGCLAFSNDGKTVFAGASTDPFLSRWKSDDGDQLSGLTTATLTRPVTAISMGASDHTLISGSADGLVLLWDLVPATPTTTASIQFATAVQALVLSQDAKSFVAATVDGANSAVRLCAISGPNVIVRQLWSSTSPAVGVSLVPTTTNVPVKLIGAWSDHISLLTAPVVRILPPKDSPGPARCVDVDSQAKFAAVGYASGKVRYYDLSGSQDPQSLDSHTAGVNAVKFTPASSKLATGADDNSILIWDVSSSPPAAAPVKTIAMSGPVSGLAIVDSTGGYAALDEGNQHLVRPIDLSAGTSAVPVAAAADRINTITLLSDNLSSTIQARLVIGSNDRTAAVWQQAGAALPALASPNPTSHAPSNALCAAWVVSDQTHFVTGSDDGIVRVWDSAHLTNDPVQLDPTKLDPALPANRVNAVAAVGNHVIVADEERTLKVWDSSSPSLKPVAAKGHTRQVLALALSDNGNVLASGSADKTVRLWNVPAMTPLPGWPAQPPSSSGAVTALAFNPGNTRIAAVDDVGTLNVWTVSTGAVVLNPGVVAGAGKAYGLAWSDNGKELAVAVAPDRVVFVSVP